MIEEGLHEEDLNIVSKRENVMSLVVNTNVASLAAQRNLNKSQGMLQTSFQRLSSGFRINSAKDDAAGMAVVTKLNATIRSNLIAERNTNDGISMAQVGEGALGAIADTLTRMRELAVQAANGSYSSTDRGYLNTEYKNLQVEVKRIQSASKYAGTKLVAQATATITFQAGTESSSENQIVLTMGACSTQTVVTTTSTVSTAAQALAALGLIDTAFDKVSLIRSRFGAVMNRLEITTNNLSTERINLSAAASRIRDVDVADESASLARTQVLVQAATSILAQANQSPQAALTLLRG